MPNITEKINNYLGSSGKIKTGTPYIYQYRNKYIIDTKHSIDRKYERAKEGKFVLNEQELIFMFEKIIDFVIKNEHKWRDSYQTDILFFSKSLNQGIVITYREDKYARDDEKHVVILTYLPKGRSNPKPGTKKVITESKDLIDAYNVIKITEQTINENKEYEYWKHEDVYEDGFVLTSYWSNDNLIDLSVPLVTID